MSEGEERPSTGETGSPASPEADAQALSDRDQTVADTEQSESDLDQTASEADQEASASDQLASDRDQQAADEDQEASDRSGVDPDGYARTKRARSKSTLDRDRTAHARSETARIRDETAERRDRLADDRDNAARGRDRLAETLDAEIARLENDTRAANGRPQTGVEVLLKAAAHRKRAAAMRARAAAQRVAAAADRASAARDRQRAALDRAASAEELALEGTDHLTGALRRRVGLAAIQREMDRTARSGEPLVVAFIDIDGLKPVNDAHGHAAGDELLRETVHRIREHLRSYDVITRFGGDEFVCSISGQTAGAVRERFDKISVRPQRGPAPATFTVGLAERREGDTLDELVARADQAMCSARARPTNHQ
jgi:diguanylate cyclase (GGDEF)-like protein